MSQAVVEAHVLNDVPMVKAWREHLGLTQQTVCNRAGLLQPALARIEAGSKPRKATLEKLAAAMGPTVAQLVARVTQSYLGLPPRRVRKPQTQPPEPPPRRASTGAYCAIKSRSLRDRCTRARGLFCIYTRCADGGPALAHHAVRAGARRGRRAGGA